MNATDRLLDHPHAAEAAAALRQLEPLLGGWNMQTSGDALVLDMWLREDRTQLRVWIDANEIVLDVAVNMVPYQPHVLTWILMQNLTQEFRAYASPPDAGLVPITVRASYPLSSLPHLGRLIWAGFRAALSWRGRIWHPSPALNNE